MSKSTVTSERLHGMIEETIEEQKEILGWCEENNALDDYGIFEQLIDHAKDILKMYQDALVHAQDNEIDKCIEALKDPFYLGMTMPSAFMSIDLFNLMDALEESKDK